MNKEGVAFLPEEAGTNRGGLRGVILLSLLLCVVFFLAIGAYGLFAAASERGEGELPGAVMALRELFEENEAVAVFLGFVPESEGDTILTDAPPEEDEDYLAAIREAADAYIRDKQGGTGARE